MHQQSPVFTLCVTSLTILLASNPASLQAHPAHVSIAEVEYNFETAHLEIALRVAPEDLERVLAARTGIKVRLESTPGIDSLIVDYLNEVFVLVLEDSVRQRVEWVGKEVAVRAAWLYFELALPAETARATLGNRLFFEHEPAQVNTVNLRLGEEHHTLTFTPKTLLLPLPSIVGAQPGNRRQSR